MKKLLFILTMGLTFMQVPDNCVYGQNSKKSSENRNERNFMPSIRKLAEMENSALTGAEALGRNYVSTRAIRDFMDRFDQVENARWFAMPDGGFESYFIQDGLGQRVIYDKRGGWHFSLITYKEDKLPRNIRSAIKSVYFDFEITLAEELQTILGTEWVVNLEDESHIRVVKVTKDGEMEVLQELNK